MLRILVLSCIVCFAFADMDAIKRQVLRASRNAHDLISRGLFDCMKDVGGACNPYTKCCGSLDCYYQDGYDPIQGGVCVECIERDQKCQRDVSCCAGLQCDKPSAASVDGRCTGVRAVGAECHSDSQCPGVCAKAKWYHVNGRCT